MKWRRRKVVNIGLKIGVNRGVHRDESMDINMVVDLKDGITQRFIISKSRKKRGRTD